MIPAIYRRAELLWMTLVLAPILEEGAFRLVLYGWLRRFMAFLPAAVISSLAFGIYHGNWIQGTYAFLLGMVLAWGYEGSEYRKYPMAVLMLSLIHICTWAFSREGYETIIVNNNPETVSTDFDIADKLYFEPLTPEDVESIVDIEKPDGAVVQFGGQTAIKLTEALMKMGVPILGTAAEDVDAAEDRLSLIHI